MCFMLPQWPFISMLVTKHTDIHHKDPVRARICNTPEEEQRQTPLEYYHTTLQHEHNIIEHGSIANHMDYTIKRETFLIAKDKQF